MSKEKSTFTMYNLLGQPLLTVPLAATEVLQTIPVGTFANGMYTYKVILPGCETVVGKFLIKK